MKRNGFRPSHRNRWLLLREGLISREGILFWEYCIDQMLYDKRNRGYGTAEIDFGEVMEVFGVKSLTTVRTWYKELVGLGLVIEIDKGKHILKITNFDRYIAGSNGRVLEYEADEYNQSIDAIIQSIGFSSQSIDRKNHSTDQKIDNLLEIDNGKALSSFKVDLSLDTKQKVRTPREYQEIYKNGNYAYMTPDEMEWVDRYQFQGKGLVQQTGVGLSDQDIADVFFSGDLSECKLHMRTVNV